MRFSRLGLFVFILSTVLIGSNCAYYNRIIARKNLVDGAAAYQGRKFQEAQELFRQAVARDPKGETVEGRTAQLFLARTLHSEYIGNRRATNLAEQAIQEYQKVLASDPKDQSAYKAVANLYENLGKDEEWLKWVTARSTNESVPGEQRAEALTSLAAKKNTCANEISDTEETKKTVTRDGKPSFEFVKPADQAKFDELKRCAQEGVEMTRKAVELDPNSDSAWSYHTSLLIQNMRVAEMEGNKEQAARIKTESDQAKEKFTALADARRQREEAEAERKKAEAEAANKK